MLELRKDTIGRASTISESVEMGLRFIGMWPHCAYANINWWTYIVSVAIMQYFQYAFIFAHFDLSDLSVFVDGLSITFGYSLSFLKLINLWFNRRKLFAILNTMDKDWSDAIHSDVSTMIRYANWSRQCSNLMITTNALAVFFYVIGGLIFRSMIQKNDSSIRELPIKMEFPFKVDNFPIFELILILQFFHDLSVACIIAMLNALLVTLVLHVSGQIDIMLQGFMEISSKHTSRSSLAAIKDLVNRHQRIIDLSDDIEDLFSNIALLQFIWNTLVICCIGFVIVISIGTEEGATTITKSLIFYVAITLEAFVFCYAGEYLSAKSKSISDAAYECLWYDLTPSECRILMFLMLRSQKRLTITAGKITDLSLEGFTTCVINNSYESTMMSVADLSHRCTNVMISINALAAFFLSIGEHLLQSIGDINGVDNNSRELPIKMEFPFDVSESPIFECFLIGQFLYELVLASIVGMMNALLVSLILHVSGQIDIMQQDINEISNSKYDPSLSLIVIKDLICKHQKIITLSENIENLYTYIALMQLLWNTLVICCTGFMIIITIGTNASATTSIKSVSFYIAITLEVFILCFAGEFLSAKSRSISDTVYESLWYNMPPTNSRILSFMILRSQKRLTITAGKVVDLTLEGFTNDIGQYASVFYAFMSSFVDYLVYVGYQRAMKRANTISLSVEIGLRFIGMWPDSAYPNLYWFSYMTTIAIVQYYQYTYIFVHFDLNDLWLLMDCLSLTLAYSLAFLKLLVLWIFYYIVKAIDKDWKECVINDSYKSTMMSMADLSRRFANVSFSIYAFSAFSLSIGEHLLQSMDDQFGNSSRELPIKMKFPFDVSRSPIFECFLIGQFLYDLVIACVVNLINALLVALILHVSGQIDIMQQDLFEISNKKYDRNTFLPVIKSFIYNHQRIIILSENIENLYTYIALMQVLWNTLVMCCTGFVIIIIVRSGEDTTNLIKSVSYYITIILEVFVYCFAGEFLSAKSKSISNAVYEALWYNMPPSDSRIILFMILRCQKRLTITAGRFIDLTLEGFTSIVKASVSYVSVLNAMIFYYILKAIDEDWSECVINDSYKSTMVSMADLSRRFANVSFSIYAFSAFFLSIGEHLLQSMDDQFSNSSRELPIKMEFPFDISKSPIFECFLIGQFLYDLVIASVVNLINALLVALILHVSGQINIMQQDLFEISNKKYDSSTFLPVIKSLIGKHQKIITLSESIENLYTYIALMQVLWNTLVMCCTGFVIIIVISSGEDTTYLIKSVSYYFAIMLEVFVYCFAGEFLSAKSKSISNSAYEALWYNMPPSDSRIILFMILRCQKRLTITAGRFMDLTLEGFTSIVKASVSYISVLNAMTFYNIVAAVRRDWNDRVVSNSYSTMMAIANQSSRYSVVLIGLHFLTGFSLSIGAYMFRTINTDSEAPTREFPVKMQFSFVVSESPVFECILFGQIFFLMLIAPVVGMINALLATLILHVGGQIDIMRQAIMDVHSNDKIDTSLTVLRDLIHRHRKIITLSNDIETLFSFIALLQLLWNTLIICFCGFMIILALSSNKGIMVLIKSMFLYTVKTLEVFVFCYAGEFLSSKITLFRVNRLATQYMSHFGTT
ncbi:OR13A protein, partial [Acromyrmex heyeri]